MGLLRILSATLFSLTLVMTGACNATPPQFTGFVTLIDRRADTGEVTVTIESHANKMVQRHVLTVTAKTEIVKDEAGVEHPATLDALAVKGRVKVWFREGAMNVYPRDVTAQRIVILDKP